MYDYTNVDETARDATHAVETLQKNLNSWKSLQTALIEYLQRHCKFAFDNGFPNTAAQGVRP